MKHYMVGNFVVLAQRYVDKVFIMSIVVYDQKERERRRRQYLIVVIFVSLFLFFFFSLPKFPAIFFIYIYFFFHTQLSQERSMNFGVMQFGFTVLIRCFTLELEEFFQVFRQSLERTAERLSPLSTRRIFLSFSSVLVKQHKF